MYISHHRLPASVDLPTWFRMFQHIQSSQVQPLAYCLYSQILNRGSWYVCINVACVQFHRVRAFLHISELTPHLGLPEGSELIETTVIRGAIHYLTREQKASGRFPVIGFVHNHYLMVRTSLYVQYTFYEPKGLDPAASESR